MSREEYICPRLQALYRRLRRSSLLASGSSSELNAVVMAVLSSGGEDAAERYLLHGTVAKWRSAVHFEEHADLLGWEHTPANEMEAIQAAAAAILLRFGESFKSDYGWAAEITGKKNPGISDLEEIAQLERWRPFSKWANNVVHAGPRGFDSLGHGLAGAERKYLLAGASNAGLADPGQNTALTMALIAGTLWELKPTADRIVMFHALVIMSQRAQESFVVASDEVERRTRENESKRKAADVPVTNV
jgi:hypothetical protein